MSITPITTDQLRRIEDRDGLILQGCGGSLQEWQDGINNLLTEIGILKDGSKFENIRVFQHEGRTCLLFPFTDDLQINMGKMAIWRLQSHEQFEGMWLSDYVDIRLGGPLQEQQHNGKPDCPLIGDDGNIFYMMSKASRTLKEHGMPDQAQEMRQRIEQCQSYDSALSIIGDYVNITSGEQAEELSIQVTKAQKMLNKKSGCQATPQMEHEVLYLLNTLAGKPELIEIPDIPPKANSRVETLQAELEELLGMLPVDEVQARQKQIETTVAMYEAIDPREYETQRLKRIFGREQVRTELDANLLEQSVAAVTVNSMGKVRIRLKNDQIIERRECGE